jgi:hypothetical protein
MMTSKFGAAGAEATSHCGSAPCFCVVGHSYEDLVFQRLVVWRMVASGDWLFGDWSFRLGDWSFR